MTETYYCFKIYYATYDYGGNMDTCSTKFPVLSLVTTDKDEAEEWKNFNEKKKNYRMYDIKASDFVITTDYEEYSCPEIDY